MRLILGSQSPRRKEILSRFSIAFDQVHSSFVEENIPFTGNPAEYAMTLSNGKSDSLYPQYPAATILTADTVVFLEGKVYNKPQSLEEAISFLTEYSGKWQSVFTGVTVRQGLHKFTSYEETKLLFNHLTSNQIRHFLECIHWQDKGGGFTVEGIGCLLIKKIEGNYDNITGLPVNLVRELLAKVGIDLWQFIK